MNMKRDDSLFSASEIGQFTFCSVSWFLKRKGYHSPPSKKKSHGMRIHNKMGRKTHQFDWLVRLSYLFILGGMIILLILFFFIEKIIIMW
jgi:hypothetical protein